MKDPFRPTAARVELIDCDVELPTPGRRVLVLTLGNTLVPAIWGSDTARYSVAWMGYPDVPMTVKQKLLEQYK